MNISNWNWSQIGSVIGALLAVAIGLASIPLGWMTPAAGLATAFVGLSMLGVHVGGAIAGNTK
jgi:hypothetical protein